MYLAALQQCYMHTFLPGLCSPTEYVQEATLSGMTKVQLAVTQVNMVKTLECHCLQSQRRTGC